MENSLQKFSGFQSTLPARGSDRPFPCNICFDTVSIHAPREGERRPLSNTTLDIQFQSTLPARGSDEIKFVFGFDGRVSIHAPREGERQAKATIAAITNLFQSTLPARGSDARVVRHFLFDISFQSTLPARGSDW